jgi:hypothetical protein
MSVDLQSDGVVLDRYRERLDRLESGERLRPAGGEVEEGAVAGTLDRAGGGVELALGERAVVVRAAVLDRVIGALAVEDADLDPVAPGGSSAVGQTEILVAALSVKRLGLLQSPPSRPSAA